VARGTQHRKRRPPAHARVAAQQAGQPRRPSRPAYEDQLFFGRLRGHAKWMFVLLAVIFGVSFVIFGVGSGSTGISQVLQNFFSGSSATGSSLSSLQKQTVQHPKSPKAWRDYATKLEQKNQDDNAIAALTKYTALRPNDEGALRELAGIYLRRASDWNTVFGELSAKNQALAPSELLTPDPTSPLGKAVNSVTTPIASALGGSTGAASQEASSKVQGYLTDRVTVYKKLATLSPKDAVTQYSLAQAASDANDTTTEIAAYKAFLKLAPDDSQAPFARVTLKQLEKQVTTATATPGGTTIIHR
jgi:tetratricopeptide (TPR) repeat protein